MASNHCCLQQQHSQLNGPLHLCLCRNLHTQITTILQSRQDHNSQAPQQQAYHGHNSINHHDHHNHDHNMEPVRLSFAIPATVSP
ncbi:hypothetical protein M0R45_020002 [Rubus argutus]|uniref:Uncharacterized protein n=1 Tax=Rubus argutus TaxID=59490 RepID=A0AAW1X8G1_RUBAR